MFMRLVFGLPINIHIVAKSIYFLYSTDSPKTATFKLSNMLFIVGYI
jgi:hypothetical protein